MVMVFSKQLLQSHNQFPSHGGEIGHTQSLRYKNVTFSLSIHGMMELHCVNYRCRKWKIWLENGRISVHIHNKQIPYPVVFHLRSL